MGIEPNSERWERASSLASFWPLSEVHLSIESGEILPLFAALDYYRQSEIGRCS
jgi:hypothetical protein